MTEPVWVFPGDVLAIAKSIGSQLEPDNAAWTNRFVIESTSSDRKYVVAQRKTDGVWGCGCPAWTRNRDRWCKHIAELNRRLRAIGYDISDTVNVRRG